MRILHLDSGREMRGGQWQVLYLLRGLRERGHELKLIARGPLRERAKAEGFEVVASARRGWAEVIHAHDAKSHSKAAFWGWCGARTRACRVATPGDARPPSLIVSRRVAFPIRTGFLSRWKYSRADHYIAISDFVASKLVEAGIKSEAISVVYDGVPLAAESKNSRLGKVVAPATDDPMKGSDLVRESAALVGLEVAFSANLADDLTDASVFVYVTRSEGLGSGVLLAMAHGVPVVASRVGGLTEVIEDRVSGLLVDNTPESIAHGIRKLLDDENLRERIGRSGYAIAGQRFSLVSMVEGTMRVYEKVRA